MSLLLLLLFSCAPFNPNCGDVVEVDVNGYLDDTGSCADTGGYAACCPDGYNAVSLTSTTLTCVVVC